MLLILSLAEKSEFITIVRSVAWIFTAITYVKNVHNPFLLVWKSPCVAASAAARNKSAIGRQPMLSLLELPKDVWCVAIASFLRLRDLRCLDCSVTNASLWMLFLANIRGCKYFPTMVIRYSSNEMTWRNDRKIPLVNVFIRDWKQVNAELNEELFSTTRELSMSLTSACVANKLIATCSSQLSSLSLFLCSEIKSIDGLSMCISLRYLSISECRALEAGSFTSAIPFCVNLDTLSVSKCPDIDELVIRVVFGQLFAPDDHTPPR